MGVFADIRIEGEEDADFVVRTHIPRHEVERQNSLGKQSRQGLLIGAVGLRSISLVLRRFLIVEVNDAVGHPCQWLLDLV